MTNMEHAMKQANITLPLIHRVWLTVKDYPGADCGKIATVLGVKRSHASSSLADLTHRKMVITSEVEKKVRSGHGFSKRHILTYTVNPRMQEYELWPRSHKPRTKPKAAPAAPAPAYTAATQAAIQAAVVDVAPQMTPAPQAAPKAAPAPFAGDFMDSLRKGAPAPQMPVQMLEKPVAREVPQGVTITLPPRVPTFEEIDRWAIADARRVYDYLRDYFTA